MNKSDTKPSEKSKFVVLAASLLTICVVMMFITVSVMDIGQRPVNGSVTVDVIAGDNANHTENENIDRFLVYWFRS